MAKRCKRGQKLGPDGRCYSKQDYKKKFFWAADSGSSESSCIAPSKKARVRVCVSRDESKVGRRIDGAVQACGLLREAENSDRESFYVLYLDSGNRLNGIEEAHRGTLSHVEVHPREVFKGALAANASSVVVAHNHPSGSPHASQSDFDLTERLVKSGELLGIPVIDHVIVSSGGCSSIRAEKPALFSVEPLKKKK